MVQIRKLRMRDRKDFLRMLLASFEREIIEDGYSVEGAKKWLKWDKRFFGLLSYLGSSQRRKGWVAIKKNKVVGAVTVFQRSKDQIEVSSMVVDESVRRQGIGKKLMERVVQEYGSKFDLTLGVREDNIAARALYESVGFTIDEDEGAIEYHIPMPEKPLAAPEGFTYREAKKSDMGKLGKIIQIMPEYESVPQIYTRFINKSKKRPWRFQFFLTAVIVQNHEINGVGVSSWGRFSRLGDVRANAVLPSAKIAYPGFLH